MLIERLPESLHSIRFRVREILQLIRVFAQMV